ncbi:DAK2 domain-containing protein [Nocardia abscessus]|uniref:DAK2 domain-containing protein n=1 Tax=Nocardia abscessus TaxID=120957 RepID=UPI003CC7FBEA
MTVSGARDVLDGTALLCWGRTCLAGLEHRREEINALNVFPVPDADTGTNLLATMRAAVEAAEAAAASRADTEASEDGSAAHAVAVAMAHGATVGARGNSGIILSQVLRGVAEAVDGGPFTADSLRVALTRASELVREALSVPIEGTILTVLDCAAAAAAGCPDETQAGVALAAGPPGGQARGRPPHKIWGVWVGRVGDLFVLWTRWGRGGGAAGGGGPAPRAGGTPAARALRPWSS